MTDTVNIPTEFWTTVTKAQWNRLFKTGRLNARQCRRLWRMCDYQGEPPRELEIQIHWPSLEKYIEEHKMGSFAKQ